MKIKIKPEFKELAKIANDFPDGGIFVGSEKASKYFEYSLVTNPNQQMIQDIENNMNCKFDAEITFLLHNMFVSANFDGTYLIYADGWGMKKDTSKGSSFMENVISITVL